MKKDIIMPLNTVNHYTRLPDGQSVKLFQKFLTENSHQSDISIKQYFLATHSLKDAFLIACFCFGQLKFLDFLSSFSISTETINYLRIQMSQFCWNKISPLSTFEENSKKFGKIYPYYWQNVQKRLNDRDSQELFKRVKDNHLLFGVKIRRWKELEKPIENYRNLQRLYEQTELMRVDGTRYLLFAQTSSGNCNFGVLQHTYQKDSRLKYPDPIQVIEHIRPIEQIGKKEKIKNINTFDFHKEHSEGYQFRKQKQFYQYQPTQIKDEEREKIYHQKKELMDNPFSKKIKQNSQVTEMEQTKQLADWKKFQQVKKFQQLPRIEKSVQRNKNKQQQDNQYKLKSQSTAQQKSTVDKIYEQNKSNIQIGYVYTPSWDKNIIADKKSEPNYDSNVNRRSFDYIKSTSPQINNKNKTGLTEIKFNIIPSKYQRHDHNQQQVDHIRHRTNPQGDKFISNQQQNFIAQNTQINQICCPNCTIM